MENGGINITSEQLQEMMQQVVATAIKAAKELPDDEKLERQKKQELRDRSIQQAREQVEAEERAKTNRQSNCAHKKENGKWATSGQVIGGKFAMLICQRCQRSWMWQPDPETIAQLLAGDLVLFQAEPPHTAIPNQFPPVARERVEQLA